MYVFTYRIDGFLCCHYLQESKKFRICIAYLPNISVPIEISLNYTTGCIHYRSSHLRIFKP